MNGLKGIDFININQAIWVANKAINVPTYDFRFDPLFEVSRPRIEVEVPIIARIGTIIDYFEIFKLFSNQGFHLINNINEHLIASELEHWYPLISELTPKSRVYENFPCLEELRSNFDFPIFIKGNRQTSKHNASLSVAKTEKDYLKIQDVYKKDPILHWQKIVIRQFVHLKPLDYKHDNKVQISYEFRTFWWKNKFVGAGHYWSQYLDYDWSLEEEEKAISIVQKAIDKLNIPFIAIDVALTANNNWIIIECNDAQESGYCGVNPFLLWQNIIAIEKANDNR